MIGVRLNHTPDSYSKDIDITPPIDDKVHRVDPDSDRVQKPYEAPSGEWSRAGVKTEQYRTDVLKGGESTRHCARNTLTEHNGVETSKSAEKSNGRGE